MIDTVYKIVRMNIITPHNQRSLFTNGPIRVFYEENIKSYPILGGSYLYAFSDLNHALEFSEQKMLHLQQVFAIYKCRADTVELEPMISPNSFKREFWDFFVKTGRFPHYKKKAPEGTVLCKWIKLLRRVK